MNQKVKDSLRKTLIQERKTTLFKHGIPPLLDKGGIILEVFLGFIIFWTIHAFG